MTAFPVARASALADSEVDTSWLIENLWAESTVGIVGGEPKCCKSFLALDMAVAVGSGRPCLGQFTVHQTGSVLLYAAEDALSVVRQRLEGIARSVGVALEELDIQVITAPSLRIDTAGDQARLRETIHQLRPRLLILDPFVRLHRIDENLSQEVVPILSYLRELQRALGVAVVLVHHAKKGGRNIRAGQALRGSSEFHAWADTILYLRRTGEKIDLTIEHRAAPSAEGIALALDTAGPRLACTLTQRDDPEARVEVALEQASHPLSLNRIRALCRVRAATAAQVVARLVDEGRIEKTDKGYTLAR